MKVVIINFPGTNCERDTAYAFELLGAKCEIIWHTNSFANADLVVLPGGFSYGDYLRTGAIAKLSPAMKSLFLHVKKGGYVLGICNGFQILCEAGLLPGALHRNSGLDFISKMHFLKVASNDNKFLQNCEISEVLNIPIAHGEGNYYIDENGLDKLKQNNQILLTYCDKDGNNLNPNGSIEAIAGICDTNKRVFGLMPHPERACQKVLGSDDGVKMLKGFLC
ncbi:phosphoribosylformylglycinamidine synthase subunit PurQ [Campylobacter sp. 19-13652]|uniref:phosphoribosylformylglycinamidine synthase subunit PurQ n=1 Tax=Campylobacter sp. 19-13652 TaxID=2840180 RepID=UPI001C770C3E|nr:phosphoribosylformylglycinamidine synthase subunit PurQ [Campylobacter sp. 19-13652]BCX79564.1 phosphoribosylformylglycinamidine synthase subunit PurQ [Campylobacter sp. 19-13652]